MTPHEEYRNHIENCGEIREHTHCLGEPGRIEIRQSRVYDLNIKKIGNCWHQHTCNECGVMYTIDSSG